MAMGSAPDAITVADGGGDLTAPMLKIMSVPVVEIIPIERRYICGVNSCKLFYQRFRQTERAPKCSVLLVHGFGEHVGRFYHVIEVSNASLSPKKCMIWGLENTIFSIFWKINIR
jgi:hypothetical protein